MNEIKIVSQNINGLNNCIKRKRVLQTLKREGDIILLQETHLNKIEHEKLGKLASAQVFASSYGTARRGVAIIIPKRIPFELEKCVKDKEGRYVLVVGKVDGKAMSLLNIYNPPGQDSEFMRRMVSLLITEAKGLAIMGGDLNMAMSTKDTQSKGKHKSIFEVTKFTAGNLRTKRRTYKTSD
uniref:exodeoxyribonuclease III n=1 Tax=Neogobius melanostomus TaxID=47308 RepID=A0A8C6WZP1_9GOBI